MFAATLTSAEKRALEPYARGDTPQETARKLGCRPTTIDKHLSTVVTKFSVPTRAAALHAAYCTGQLTPPEPPSDVSFTDEQRERLLRVARGEAKAPPVADLLELTRARTLGHLIAIGHALGELHDPQAPVRGAA
ncbi:LuxR C-terminal-related transcriptional regulator [Streptomyces sp. NPDC057654]|uniref:LuxR C-terminal-related transcriptional regulator n=1 Tax=Streptomyces sp. NPDC057654 TaxID=3346196 RepID=UPI003699F6F3